MRTAIEGIGVVGGFGCGVEKLRRALICGKCTPKMIPVTIRNQTAELPVYLCDTSSLETFIN
ncbi:MAG: beta-ketoacyl synthase, partial [Desulfobacterales bacterium]|nr:beta-ketoacyl synthase [Desulfobacterales bacterium]